MNTFAKLNTNDFDLCQDAYLDLLIESDDGMLGKTYQNAVTMKHLECFLEEIVTHPAVTWVSTSTEVNSKLFRVGRIYNKPIDTIDPRYRNWRDLQLLSFPNYQRIISMLPKICRYSESVEIFRTCCDEYPIDQFQSAFYDMCKKPFYWFGTDNFKLFSAYINNFMGTLRERLKEPATRKRILDRRSSSHTNYLSCLMYVDRLFEKCARLVVIRVDLGYQKGKNEDLATTKGDLERLYRNRRHNKLFLGLKGYILKIEYGIDKGIHCHALLFFDGSVRNNTSDSYISRKIGEYWRDVITSGRGSYWNCNAHKEKYWKIGLLGIGLIHAADEGLRTNLKRVIQYFCKNEQFIKLASTPKMKLLHKGLHPKLNKRGRPRKLKV